MLLDSNQKSVYLIAEFLFVNINLVLHNKTFFYLFILDSNTDKKSRTSSSRDISKLFFKVFYF